MGIFERAGRYLGGSGLHRIDWNVGSFEIGYWIRKSAHGMGYVTEATKLLTQFAFEGLHANRVFITVAAPNVRSSAIPKRLGFVHEGTLRNSVRDVEGNLHDRLIFGMIPEEWKARAG
jgi:RimJ/RimL family protein N-acetyltransferase